jgi:ribosomal protein L37AE/L43A
MLVHFMGLDFSHYDQAEGEHVTLEMSAPPAKGTRIIFNGGSVYVITHDPEYFINTGTVPWNDERHGDREAWVEACWVLVQRDDGPAEALKHSVDPREGMTDEQRERFDRQMERLMAEVHSRLAEPDPVCPQCGRPTVTTVWRQDDCTPRTNPRCYKSSDQMQALRAMREGC